MKRSGYTFKSYLTVWCLLALSKKKAGWLITETRTIYQHYVRLTDRLSHLFFSGLNNSSGVNIIDINNGGFLKDLIDNVPFLNGGLFEQGQEEKDSKIVVPDECIDSILHDLFQKFAFTVTESTPLDVEVAVDPEMLSKVFEELVTERHESGSYYTPKPIVSFVCRESIKGYLKTQNLSPTLSYEEREQAIALLVDEQNSSELTNSESILSALKKVKTCDLACGSGAYLLGMLHELLESPQGGFGRFGLSA